MQRGWTVAESLVVTEAGVSGASRHNRPGLLELMAAIDSGDVLLCWDSSRLARDSEDLGWIRNRLRANRRTSYEVSTGAYTHKASTRGFAGNVAGKGGRGPARHMLSGLLECGCCGGGFHAQNSAGRYGCGWHRGRGPVACSNSLTVPRVVLEERIFGAIRERILVPDVVAYAVEHALGIVAAELSSEREGAPPATRERLAEIADELATLRRLAERGKGAQVAALIADLEAERASLTAPAAERPEAIDPVELRASIEGAVRDLRAAFEGDAHERRIAFRALLGDRKMRSFPTRSGASGWRAVRVVP